MHGLAKRLWFCPRVERACVLELHAADFLPQRRSDKPGESLRGGGGRQPGRMDIADAIALGIGASHARRMNKVGAEAIGNAKPGSLAEQNKGELCAQQFAN